MCIKKGLTDLVCNPSIGCALCPGLHMLSLKIIEPNLQEIIIDINQLHPSGPELDLAKDMVLVIPERPVKGTKLERGNSAGGHLL